MSEDKKSESVALARSPSTAISQQAFRFVPMTLGEATEMAQIIAGSNLCPTAYRGKPADTLIAYELGRAIGLAWLQALANIAVINGRPGIYGDLIPALILATGECERFHSPMPSDDDTEAICTIKRKGYPDDFIGRFSISDAKKANLWGKAGPWTQYPKRMLQIRARAFAARDSFPDKLMGLGIVEELMDIPAIDGTIVHSEQVQPVVSPLQDLPEALRDNIEKAFETLNLSTGQRLTKTNEFLMAEGAVPEEAATRLLEWCRDEFAKRKTGQPRAKSSNNKSSRKAADAPVESRGPVQESEAATVAPAAGAGTPTGDSGVGSGVVADSPLKAAKPQEPELF